MTTFGIKRAYIAGPMSGLPEHNYPAFKLAASLLTFMGIEVEDPSTHDPTEPRHELLKKDINMLASCDAICLLDGWEKSPGACLEFANACQFKLKFIRLAPGIHDEVILEELDPAQFKFGRVTVEKDGNLMLFANHDVPPAVIRRSV